MPLPVCTIDTSVVIALDHLNLLSQLSWLFSRVLLPKAVRDELFRRPGREERIKELSASYDFIKPCDDYDQAAVNVLFAERKAQEIRDRGEAEAVTQASAHGADVLMDDAWGRKLAEKHGRECHGTVWLLRRFHELGLASAAVTRGHFLVLARYEIRLPWKEVNKLLAEIGEQPVTDAS